MRIELKKFGTTLVSRPAGKEAWLAFQPVLKGILQDEKIIVDFDGIVVLTPSWADEFLTPLENNFKGKVKLVNIYNPSVEATLSILDQPPHTHHASRSDNKLSILRTLKCTSQDCQ